MVAAEPSVRRPPGSGDNSLAIIGACVALWSAAAAVSVAIGAVLRLLGDTRYLRRSSSAAAWSADWATVATGDVDRLPLLAVELDYDDEGASGGGSGGGKGTAA